MSQKFPPTGLQQTPQKPHQKPYRRASIQRSLIGEGGVTSREWEDGNSDSSQSSSRDSQLKPEVKEEPLPTGPVGPSLPVKKEAPPPTAPVGLASLPRIPQLGPIGDEHVAHVSKFNSALDEADIKSQLCTGLSSFGEACVVHMPKPSLRNKQRYVYAHFSTAQGLLRVIEQSGKCTFAGGVLKIEEKRRR